MPGGRCEACEARDLEPHLRVAGGRGEAGLIPTTNRFGVALADIVRCRSCGHMQLERFPSAANLADSYAEAESLDYVEQEAGQRQTAREILGVIERHTNGRRLVDLGCWVGFLLSEASARGWEATGVEPSVFASAFARERLGLDVRTADLLEADLPPASFDAVFMGDVLEHLPQAGRALDRVRVLLRPGGVIALALPDAGSRLARVMGARWWSVIPTHVHYFTRHSLETLLRRKGFEPVERRTAPKAFTVAYYLGRVGGYSPVLGRALVASANRVGVARRIWAPDLRDRMLVISTASASPSPCRRRFGP